MYRGGIEKSLSALFLINFMRYVVGKKGVKFSEKHKKKISETNKRKLKEPEKKICEYFIEDEDRRCTNFIEGTGRYCPLHRKASGRPKQEDARALEETRSKVQMITLVSLTEIGYTRTIEALADSMKSATNHFMQFQNRYKE